MRRGTNGAEVRRTEDGRLESVNLGADFTSEHEWGIKDLNRRFGIDPTQPAGIARNRVRQVPTGISISNPDAGGLALTEVQHDKRKDRWDPIKGTSYIVSYTPFGAVRMGELNFTEYTAAPIVGAWSEGDFAVHFKPDAKQDAEDLYEAFRKLDVAFLFGNTRGNPFARGGLCLAIVSRLPQEILDSLREMMLDADALNAAAEATGIKAKLDAISKRGTRGYDPTFGYFALSPRWKDATHTEVVFWLNPAQQDRNNHGTFTVADLDAWLVGEGPIPKAAKP